MSEEPGPGPVQAVRRMPPLSRTWPGRPATIVALAATVLCAAFLVAPRMGGDLSAQIARADFARRHPFSTVDMRWFGGTLPFGYSLWTPQLMARC